MTQHVRSPFTFAPPQPEGARETVLVVLFGAILLYMMTATAFTGFFFGEDFITRAMYLAANGNFLKAIFIPFGPFFRPSAVAWSMGTQLLLPFDATLHHVRNFLFLIIATTIIHRLLLRIVDSKTARLAGVTFFLMSKVQLTIIGYINCIDNIGSLIYSLSTLLLLVRYFQEGRITDYIGAIVFFSLSTFSRDSNILFFGSLVLLMGFRVKANNRKLLGRATLELLPFILLIAVYLGVRVFVVGLPPVGTGSNYPAYTIHFEPLRMLRLAWNFLATLFNISYSAPMVSGHGDLASLLGLAEQQQILYHKTFTIFGLALVITTLFSGLKIRPWALFAAGWAVAMMLPTFLIQNDQIYYAFEPVAACSILLAVCLDRGGPLRRPLVAVWLPTLAVIGINGWAHSRNIDILVWRYVANQAEAIYNQVIAPNRGQPVASLVLIGKDQPNSQFLGYLIAPPLPPSGIQLALPKALLSPSVRYFRAIDREHYTPDPNIPQPALIYRQEDDGRLIKIEGTAAKTPATATVPIPVLDHPLRIVAYGPMESPAGKPFNVQPNGMSAIWIKAEGLRAGMVILWNGRPLESTVDVAESVISALVPQSLLDKPEAATLAVSDQAGVQSAPATLTIK